MNATVLIVDDSRTVRSLVREALVNGGYSVTEAPDGKQALDALQTMLPDLIITDVNMPEMDGITFVRTFRAQPTKARVPILILTTVTDAAMKQKGRDAGATGWICKPFQPDQLRDVVRRVLEMKQK
ncbi:MAG: response regulator [Planctomycetes bacterium]|nr:response regulator [Planctomycetota bacterium]